MVQVSDDVQTVIETKPNAKYIRKGIKVIQTLL
jgi:hypothetical protein